MSNEMGEAPSVDDHGGGMRMTFAFPARFKPDEVEQAFREDHYRQFAGYRRTAAVIGLMLWLAISAGLEPLARRSAPAVYPDAVWMPLVEIRAGAGVAALSCVAILFSHYRHDKTISTLAAMAMVAVLAAAQLMLVFLVIPYPANYLFYLPGFCGIVVAFFSFAHFLSRTASAMGLASIVGIVCFALASGDPGQVIGTALMPYVALFVICHGMGVKVERYARERFGRERRLQTALSDERNAQRILNDQRELLVQLKESERRTAEQASRDKTRFLASAAHDLRQPVQALSLHLDLASRALVGVERGRAGESLALAHDATRLLHRSLDSVLEISQLESGSIRPRYEDFDLRALVVETAGLLAPLAHDRGVALRMRKSTSSALVVRSDRQLMSRVIWNLLSNAIKYSHPDRSSRKVLVSTVRLPARVRIDVVDNGIGIPRKSWDEIFEPFRQLDHPGHGRREGLGLGLAIVNAAVGLLDGHRIEIRSREGRGTRFSIDVPPTRVGSIGPAQTRGTNTVVDESGSLYVILVEDDVMVRHAVSLTLAQRGVRFETAGSFEQLQTLLATIEIDPDAVLTDYRLSATHSAQNVIALVRQTFGRHIPTVILTAEAGTLIGVTESSDCVILRKPAQPDELLRVLFAMRAHQA